MVPVDGLWIDMNEVSILLSYILWFIPSFYLSLFYFILFYFILFYFIYLLLLLFFFYICMNVFVGV
jgi:hypothetical protein